MRIFPQCRQDGELSAGRIAERLRFYVRIPLDYGLPILRESFALSLFYLREFPSVRKEKPRC